MKILGRDNIIGQRREILDRVGKYWTEWGNSRQRGGKWIERGSNGKRWQILDRDGKYWVARGKIGQRGEILDR